MTNDALTRGSGTQRDATDQERWVRETGRYVHEQLAGEGSGHDWWHIERVRKLALHIAGAEVVDLTVVELAALLHDIADHKFHDGDDTAGPRAARAWLDSLGVDPPVIEHVCEIIHGVSFKGAGTHSPMRTREGMVVQDADRLDAIGAIGIARTFAYGGYVRREIYNPDIPPGHHATVEEYRTSASPTVNHFYEKLFLLRDRMNTETGRQLAEERHRFMEAYLERFYREWNGEA